MAGKFGQRMNTIPDLSSIIHNGSWSPLIVIPEGTFLQKTYMAFIEK